MTSRFTALPVAAALLFSTPVLAQTPPPQPTPAPLTIQAVGVYKSSAGGEARLDMQDATTGSLTLDGRVFKITGDAAKGSLEGTDAKGLVHALGGDSVASGQLTLAIQTAGKHVGSLSGTLDGKPVTLTREVERPIPPAETKQSDPGPQGDWKKFFDSVPDYTQVLKDANIDPTGQMFWYNFGPVFYRGRLDGTARIMIIASDPGPDECLPFVRHPLVGDAGQRVQGFLAKLGLDKSYILVNAYAYAMRPSFVKRQYGKAIINEDFSHTSPKLTLTADQEAKLHEITTWRDEFFTRVARESKLQAIVPMGGNAGPAYDQWIATLPANDPIRKIPVFKVEHPSAVDRDPGGPRPDAALEGWQQTIPKLREIVTPDPGASNTGPNYGEYFTENDYARIPRGDLPPEAPMTMGDNSDTREGKGGNNDARRPSPDDFKTLVYTDPATGKTFNYVFQGGQFHPELTTDAQKHPVKVDANGIPKN